MREAREIISRGLPRGGIANNMVRDCRRTIDKLQKIQLDLIALALDYSIVPEEGKPYARLKNLRAQLKDEFIKRKFIHASQIDQSVDTDVVTLTP